MSDSLGKIRSSIQYFANLTLIFTCESNHSHNLKCKYTLKTKPSKLNTMSISFPDEPVPLEIGDDRVVRVKGTRVTLDTIVVTFNQGKTALEIASQYPSLQLVDVYATIVFYLRHRPYVDAYLQERQEQAREIRELNEANFADQGVRDRLLARRSS